MTVLKFHDFSRFFISVRNLNVMVGCSYLNQTQILVQAVGGWIINLMMRIRVTF